MPATGRAACSAGQSAARPHTQSTKREKAKSSQSFAAPPRRESAQTSTPPDTARPGLKGRAYSAPMVPRTELSGPYHAAQADNLSLGEAADDEEIAGDPFFQRYNIQQHDDAHDGANDDASSSSLDSSSDTEGPLSPTNIKARPSFMADSIPSPRSPSVGNDTAAMQDLNIVVVGAHGSGKSTFIRRALNLQNTASSAAISSRKMAIDGSIYIVRLLELSFSEINIGERDCINWPETIDDLATPRIDGAITIYDVTNAKSLERVPEILNALSITYLPYLLVACKCDNHPVHREVDPAVVEQKAQKLVGEINAFQTAESAPETQKRCLSVMLRNTISARRTQPQAASNRRRANSSAVRHVPPRETWSRKHERASSEFSGSRLKARTPGPFEKDAEKKGHKHTPSETVGHTFLDLEESPGYESYDTEAQDSDGGQSVATDLPSDEKGYTLDQLVERLLAQPLSKNDSKFVAIFLALYRRFGTPGQLLDSIVKRFEALKRDKHPQMIRTIAQLRHLAILQQWVSCYPGDFAFPKTRRTMRKFVSGLSSNRIFSIAAREMVLDLENVTEDDDTDWACCDRNREKAEPLQTFHTVLDEDSDEDDFAKAIGTLSTDNNSVSRSTTTATTSSSRTLISTTGSTSSSSQTMLNGIERAQKIAKTLVPNPTKPLSKAQWHLMMGQDDEAIAKELTRIDWIMFSSIRPRDLVRHVSMNADEKKRCKSLENVNRMIEHFNHVAYTVTNYILLRDKPKHRALMLEKWMRIARKLRELNNYNALGAVLAGIKGTAVHRLVATRELVPQPTSRDFMKLEILMGTQKSHFAYRLAWENSSGERIPYLPLHRRDLVSAAEGNATFVGDKRGPPAANPHPGVSVFQGAAGSRDSREAPPGGVAGKERINWRKFEIMGEVIVGVQKAQGTPYPPFGRNEDVRSLLLDVKVVKDDDELYDRSVQLEAAGAADRRRFNWFQR
ncbi:ras GEF [Mytilinidion resinicola]|uniref:Ras GEF n=1 Tax=Mytilinidion resinicola TaxID=574789 RepID=A0A6A6Y5F7_9PEZI|nr:ras GEF [Mytilinidion resinicola]KAF2803465.1 ras GEF [Mytilinidion resinicola]